MLRKGLLLTTLLVVLAAIPQAAAGAVFNASVKGSQQLTWSVNGTNGSCEIRQGVGSGEVKFAFKSPKSSPIFVSKKRRAPNMIGSVNANAKGSHSGSFASTTVTPCPGFEPAEPLTEIASGCGATSFPLRVDFKTKGAFVTVTGPKGVSSTGSIANLSCPFPIDSSLLFSTDLTACGDDLAGGQRSWGIASSSGEGLFFSKLAISSKSLLKTKKRKTKKITGRAVVECNVPGIYSGGVSFKGELKYTLSLKRVS